MSNSIMGVSPSDDAPPSYSEIDDAVGSSVNLQEDGRINFDLDSKLFRTLSKLHRTRPAFDPAAEAPIPVHTEEDQAAKRSRSTEAPIPVHTEAGLTLVYRKPVADHASSAPIPVHSEQDQTPIRLNIVIQVVGSRGDVQPFVALGCELLKHGHRVRLATHGVFRDFIRKAGLEFFSIGGDPSELMAYMVKNPGLIPSMKSIRAGDIQAKQRMMAEMLRGCWSSCISPDPVSGRPFVAEAIIANPPSFAHIHCAQALGIPIHLMFTMPWTSTAAFSHPLANFVNKHKQSRETARATANYVSYLVVEWLTWQGLGDVINTWRRSIGLEDVDPSEGPLLAETLKIPFTYCWSPALVPKPRDWEEHTDVCGFFFREMSAYDPEPQLDAFLQSGDRPVYIGFGSIVIDNPEELTSLIVKSVKAAGVRAIISKGWSSLGSVCSADPDILFLGDCPHEWLFERVSTVVHHGGAGTTACGLLNGKPTTIVPFFGDQPFWGEMVAAAGAGPAPIPYKELTTANLTEALRFCLTPETSSAAAKIAQRMRTESGVKRAVANFHRNLPLSTMRCDILPDRSATWLYKKSDSSVRLSKEAAGILVSRARLLWKDLKRYDTTSTFIDLRRLEPVTATTSSLITIGTGMASSAIDIVAKPTEAFTQSRNTNGSNRTTQNNNQLQEKDKQEVLITDGSAAATTLSLNSVSETHAGASPLKTAVAGSAAGFGGVLKHFTKGMLDAPLAVTEGFRNAPRLYGGEVYQPGRIDGVMSGGVVAGKNMAHGLVEGFGGLVMSPVRGAQSDGAVGLVKGFGVGCLNMSTKVPSGLLGLIFYPGQGVYKSIYEVTHSRTRRDIKYARQLESDLLATQHSGDSGQVLQRFEIRLTQKDERQPPTHKMKREFMQMFSSRARAQEAGKVRAKDTNNNTCA